MYANEPRPRLNWIATLLIASTMVTSSGCAKLFHMLHYNCISRMVQDHHLPYYHSPKTGRIIADEHRQNCAVEPPCFGYEQTTWHRWPEECQQPKEEVVLDLPYEEAQQVIQHHHHHTPTVAPAHEPAPASPSPSIEATEPTPSPVDAIDVPDIEAPRALDSDVSIPPPVDKAPTESIPFSARQLPLAQTPIARPVDGLGLEVLGQDHLSAMEPELSETDDISTRRNALDREVANSVPQLDVPEAELPKFELSKDVETADSKAIQHDFVAETTVPTPTVPTSTDLETPKPTADQTEAVSESNNVPTVASVQPRAVKDFADSVVVREPALRMESLNDIAEFELPGEVVANDDTKAQPTKQQEPAPVVNKSELVAKVESKQSEEQAPATGQSKLPSTAIAAADGKSVSQKSAKLPVFKIKPVFASTQATVPPIQLTEQKSTGTVIRFVSEAAQEDRVVADADDGSSLKFR